MHTPASHPPGDGDDIARTLLGLVGRWVIVTNDPALPKPDAIKVRGTHVVAFIYIDHEAGIRARFDYCCVFSSDGYPRITRTIFLDDKTLWFIRYETLRGLTLRPATKAECGAMGLPEVPVGQAAPDPGLVYLRSLKELGPFRAPGYPDDVLVCVSYDRIGGATFQEGVWARLEKGIAPDIFECTLLNEPHYASGLSVGARIEVALLRLPHAHKLVWRAQIDRN